MSRAGIAERGLAKRRNADRDNEATDLAAFLLNADFGAEEWLAFEDLRAPDLEGALDRFGLRRIEIGQVVLVAGMEGLVDDAYAEEGHDPGIALVARSFRRSNMG